VRGGGGYTAAMAEDKLTEDELEEANGEPLPDREAMSVLTPDPLDPVATLPVEPYDTV
jgi:hypothetical protein